MIYTAAKTEVYIDLKIPLAKISAGIIFLLALVTTFHAQNPIATQTDENTVVIGNAKDNEVFSFGKTVVVKEHAKGVLVFGGDVVVEGRVDGDVATIGGSIVQKETAFIGGDVIAFGGAYRPESKNPLRIENKKTVMYAGYEEELREAIKNPSQIFAPSWTVSFFTQRVLLLLFWFVISLVLTTIAPGAVSRAVARFQLSTLKVVSFGMLGFVALTVGVLLSLSFLPGYAYAIILLMAFLMMLVSFVFGRVALQVSVGKRLQKRFFPEKKHSETLALLIGTLVWTVLLSLPYFWVFAFVLLVSASFGLILTARTKNSWQKT